MNGNGRRRSDARGSLAALVAMSVLVGGCATVPDRTEDPEGYADYVEANDPLEPFNRAVFEFNRAFDTMLLRPLAIFYKGFVPPPLQRGIHNALANLREPATFVNNLLQAQPEKAGAALARFTLNSTLGIAGLSNAAEDFGWERQDEDFGQTLAVWGVGEGPFLMLPFLGPSNPRDAVGRGVDSLIIDPFGLLGALIDSSTALTVFAVTRTGLTAVDARAGVLDEFDELEKSSLDFYATLRSAFRQNRRHEIEKGMHRVPRVPPPAAGPKSGQ